MRRVGLVARSLILGSIASAGSALAQASLTVSLTDPAWNGDAAPDGLSYEGGHGVIGFPVSGGGDVDLPAVPGESDDLGGVARVVKKNRATGDYARPGYLPPCSGGRGHRYMAEVTAIAANGDVLAEGRVEIGRY